MVSALAGMDGAKSSSAVAYVGDMKRCKIPPASLFFEHPGDINLVLPGLALLGIREFAGCRDPSQVTADSSGLPVTLPTHCALIEIFEDLRVCRFDLLHALPAFVWSSPHEDGPIPGSKYFDHRIQVMPVDGVVMPLEQSHYLGYVRVLYLPGFLLGLTIAKTMDK